MDSRNPGEAPYNAVPAGFGGILRVVVTTFLATLMAFCISLFFGIIGILLAKVIRGTPTMDIRASYRYIAVPVALAVLVIAFAWTLRSEIRASRRERNRGQLSKSRTKAA